MLKEHKALKVFREHKVFLGLKEHKELKVL